MFDGVHVGLIHSSQPQLVRNAAVDSFRSGATWLLVATDLIGRGMDFLGIHTVINYDLPQSTTDYIHRVGRTGRAGRTGTCFDDIKTVCASKGPCLHMMSCFYRSSFAARLPSCCSRLSVEKSSLCCASDPPTAACHSIIAQLSEFSLVSWY